MRLRLPSEFTSDDYPPFENKALQHFYELAWREMLVELEHEDEAKERAEGRADGFMRALHERLGRGAARWRRAVRALSISTDDPRAKQLAKILVDHPTRAELVRALERLLGTDRAEGRTEGRAQVINHLLRRRLGPGARRWTVPVRLAADEPRRVAALVDAALTATTREDLTSELERLLEPVLPAPRRPSSKRRR